MSVPGMYGDIKLIAGTGNPELAQGISDYIKPLAGRYDFIEYQALEWVRF